MSNQIFNEVGLLGPTSVPTFGVANMLYLKNSTDGAAYSKGHCMRLIGGAGRDTSTDITAADVKGWDLSDMTLPTVPLATAGNTELTAALSAHVHGLLMEDIADGAYGWVLVRGYGLALMDSIATTIAFDNGLYAGDGATRNTLGNVIDITTQCSVKVLGFAKVGTTGVAAAAGVLLRPCLFNGAEGFGILQGTA